MDTKPKYRTFDLKLRPREVIDEVMVLQRNEIRDNEKEAYSVFPKHKKLGIWNSISALHLILLSDA